LKARELVFASALVAGVVMTLISGLVDVTPLGILGTTWHGWPFAWFYVIIYPGSPWSIDWTSLCMDLIVWSMVTFAIFYALLTFRTRSKVNM